jgi:hypothetical protein
MKQIAIRNQRDWEKQMQDMEIIRKTSIEEVTQFYQQKLKEKQAEAVKVEKKS